MTQEEQVAREERQMSNARQMTKPWPGAGYGNFQTAPGKPGHRAHAEVQFPGGPGRRSHRGFLGAPSLRKKTVAYVTVTWPGGSASRMVIGDWHIRMALEWVSEFNQISDSM
jgi:hypothetical protein